MSDAPAETAGDPLLDSPVQNIRIKVNMSSNEITGASGTPVTTMNDNDDNSNSSRQAAAADADQKKNKKSTKEEGDEKGTPKIDINDYVLDDEEEDDDNDDDVDDDDDSKDPSYKAKDDDSESDEDEDISDVVDEEEEEEDLNPKKKTSSRQTSSSSSSAAAATNKQDGESNENNEDDDDDDDDYDDLTGATIKIKSGKYEGLTGKINERKRFRSVQLGDCSQDKNDNNNNDTSPTMLGQPVEFASLRVLKYAPITSEGYRNASDKSGSVEELTNKYMGARVKVLDTGVIGTVVRVIVGDWWITDNPKIASAYKADKFDVVKYPDGWEEKQERRRKMMEKIESEKKKEDAKGDSKNDTNLGDATSEAATSQQGNDRAEKDEPKVKSSKEQEEEKTSEPPKKAEASSQAENNESKNEERSLIGAKIRISKGRYRGIVGTIKEKQSIRRLQLDAVPSPLGFEDVEVLEYAENDPTSKSDDDNDGMGDDEINKQYQKYVGATVRILRPEEHAGTETKVIRVIVLGDWYICGSIPMAFPEHKFNVIKYADEDDGDDGEHPDVREIVIRKEDDNVDIDDDKKQHDAEVNGGEKRDKEEVVSKENNDDVEMKDAGKNDGNTKMDKDDKRPETLEEDDPKKDGRELNNDLKGEEKQGGHSADVPSSDVVDNGEAFKDGDHCKGKKMGISPTDPLIGATVHVTTGVYKGVTGEIIMIQERGWWTVEGVTGKVSSSKCLIVDDGKVDLEKVREWYMRRSSLARMPGVIKPENIGKQDMYGYVVESEGKNEARAAARATANGESKDDDKNKRRIMETDFTGCDSKKRKLGLVEQNQQRRGPIVSSILPRQDSGSNKNNPILRDGDPPEPALNPVLIQASDNNDAERPKPLMELLPASLRNLPLDTKIEIFNRRTGRVMRGNDAVSLSDLPRVLLDHAEYEPIIPSTCRASRSIKRRVGRSGPKMRVSGDIIPQTRIRASRVEGRSVLVTGGEYRGLTGKIDSCLPGGWYLVSRLMPHDKLDVVISSSNLQLIPQEPKHSNTVITDASSQKNKKELARLRIHHKAATLRLDALIEERMKLERNKVVNDNGRSSKQVKRLSAEINKTMKQINNLLNAIDRVKVMLRLSGPNDNDTVATDDAASSAASNPQVVPAPASTGNMQVD